MQGTPGISAALRGPIEVVVVGGLIAALVALKTSNAPIQSKESLAQRRRSAFSQTGMDVDAADGHWLRVQLVNADASDTGVLRRPMIIEARKHGVGSTILRKQEK